MVGPAFEREALRRDQSTTVPADPTREPLRSVGSPTLGPAVLAENMRAPAISEFLVRDTAPGAKARELQSLRPPVGRDTG